jgi:hypothetical protein
MKCSNQIVPTAKYTSDESILDLSFIIAQMMITYREGQFCLFVHKIEEQQRIESGETITKYSDC